MLVAERQQKIVELVNERKSIRVSDMSKLFQVTEETIRRDFEKLEKDKKLIRSHGGAISLNTNDTLEIPYFQREITNVEEKKKIAMEAIKHVYEGDKIILDASTTAWYMAKELPDKPLTVMTNSIKVAMELSNKNQINVISTGGNLLSKSLSYVGPLAEAAFDSYHLDKAFISCKGFHLTRGISESNEQQARVKKKMIDSADLNYLMIDYSKFDKTAFSKISGLEVVSHLVTDNHVNQQVIHLIEEKGIEVVKVG